MSVASNEKIDAYLQQHRAQFEQELCDFLRIPSVSADSAHTADVARAADWIAHQLEELGLECAIYPTAGHPIVYAQSPPVPGKPTVLVYGHYDVQPPDPLHLWNSPPFEPTIVEANSGRNVVARGATDDKGQMFTHVKAVQAWLKTVGSLPVQVKFLIEGEEEVGSPNLVPFIEQHRDLLACDCVVISDTSQFAPGQPAITYGLRGIAYYELRLQGPNRDLHSGTFGGAVVNPANALTQMLAALRTSDGRINIPGFYDDVVPLTDRERAEFARLPFDENQFAAQLEVAAVDGEPNYTTLERRWARPTYDINGLTSGYQGEGAKTVLPAQASAKFSFRLVPNQQPAEISAALQAKLQQLCPPGITMQLIDFHGAPGVLVPLESPYIAAAQRAITAGFGTPPVFMREGGSIPVVATFRQLLQVDTLLLGWGQDDDNTHSPNEKFSLADFHKGIRASAQLLAEIEKL